MWKLALCTAMFVAWSLPAAAAHDDRSDRNVRQHERRDNRVQKLAYHLEQTADQLHARIDRRSERRHRVDPALAKAVSRLDKAASKFHRAVERHDYDSRRANERLAKLHRAYRHAQAEIECRRTGRRVRGDIDRIGSLLDRIQYRYARYERAPKRAYRPAWSVSWSY